MDKSVFIFVGVASKCTTVRYVLDEVVMKSKRALKFVIAVCALAVSPTLAMAQNAGFIVGIAQPTFGFPATQAPAIVTRSTFVAVPTLVIPAQQPITPISLIPNFPTVIVLNQILVPGQTFISPQAPLVGFQPQHHGWW